MLNFFEYKLRKSGNSQRLKEVIRIFFVHSLALAKFVIAKVGARKQCEKRFIENTFDWTEFLFRVAVCVYIE